MCLIQKSTTFGRSPRSATVTWAGRASEAKRLPSMDLVPVPTIHTCLTLDLTERI